jgi:hypothetical protein
VENPIFTPINQTPASPQGGTRGTTGGSNKKTLGGAGAVDVKGQIQDLRSSRGQSFAGSSDLSAPLALSVDRQGVPVNELITTVERILRGGGSVSGAASSSRLSAMATRGEAFIAIQDVLHLPLDPRAALLADPERQIALNARLLGIMRGYADGSLALDHPVTRSELTIMTHRALEVMKKKR